MKESKADRFRRVAGARVNKIIKLVRLLGNCSQSAVYAFTTEQVQQVFATLQDELNRAQSRFAQSHKRLFSLSDEQYAKLPEYPTIVQLLPDGSRLRAVAINGDSYPCINIYWDSDKVPDQGLICFAEYNPEHTSGLEVCVGAYRSDQEDTTYYEPYLAERD